MSEQNSNMDELLKAHAKKRRAEAGPVELHPATRKMLLAEAQRLHSKKEATPEKTPTVSFWPRLGLGFAVAVAAVGLLYFLSPRPPGMEMAKLGTEKTPTGAREPILEPARKTTSEKDAETLADRGSVAEKKEQPAPAVATKALNPSGGDRRQLEASTSQMASGNKQVGEADNFSTLSGKVARTNAALESQKESSPPNTMNFAFKNAPLGSNSLACAIPPSAIGGSIPASGSPANSARLPNDALMASGHLSAPQEKIADGLVFDDKAPAVATRPGISGTFGGSATPAQISPAHEDFKVTTTAPGGQGGAAPLAAVPPAPAVTTLASTPSPSAAPSLYYDTDKSALAKSSPAKASARTLKTAYINGRARMAGPQTKFVQQNTFDNYRKNTLSPPVPAVLTTFQVSRNGNRVQVVDADGSVYDGEILQPEAKQDLAKNKDATVAVEALQKANRVKGPVENPASPDSGTYSFRVSGMNNTLRQMVSFEGTTQLAIANTATAVLDEVNQNQLAKEERSKLAARTEQNALQNSNSVMNQAAAQNFINGRVNIGGTNEFPMNAVETK